MLKIKFMRHILCILVAIAVFIFTAVLYSQEEKNKAQDIAVAEETTLKFFGYYNLDKGVTTDFINFIGSLDNSNVGHVNADLSKTKMDAVLTALEDNEMQAIINIEWIFLQNRSPGGNGNGSAVLRTDWQT